jgi:imidazoleglycerol-phosphate dehydratase
VRIGTVERKTSETDIKVSIHLDGTGQHDVSTGVGFLDHMLGQVAVHGLFDLSVQSQGDLEIDAHHTMEDVALTLGLAVDRALGDRKGLVRMGHAYVPMDEALALVVIDLSGRPYTVVEGAWHGSEVGRIPTSLIAHFFESFAVTARANVHASILAGRDNHHQAEALFKALGRALEGATRMEPRRLGVVPSTKGIL